MIFKQILSGGDRNYGYLVACENSKLACVVDPSPDPDPIYQKVLDLALSVKYVINTHSHFDHTSGNHFFKEKSEARVVAHESVPGCDMSVKDNSTLALGDLILTFFYTPGHTNDSICLLVEEELMTGDTLFVGKVGGTITQKEAKQEFASLQKLMTLDDHIRVWPGHNYGVRPSSTILVERTENPFCVRLDKFDDFVWLKDNWAQFKMDHNIP